MTTKKKRRKKLTKANKQRLEILHMINTDKDTTWAIKKHLKQAINQQDSRNVPK